MSAARPAASITLLLLVGSFFWGSRAAGCPDDPELDLCDDVREDVDAAASLKRPVHLLALVSALGLRGQGAGHLAWMPLFVSLGSSMPAAKGESFKQKLKKDHPVAGTCGDMKDAYKKFECCGKPDQVTGLQFVPLADKEKQKYGPAHNANPCEGQKKWLSDTTNDAFKNKPCKIDDVVDALEQAGANVTKGYTGSLDTAATPINVPYYQKGLCPVNVHWHLGAEHLSVGEFDEHGIGPEDHVEKDNTRRLADYARLGFRCHHYNATHPGFATEYKWMHCTDMKVGETYEVHWPHSSAGMCGTPNQYQTPFYDGVFCNKDVVQLVLDGKATTYENIGVQSQVFTVINDEAYYYPDLMRGMIVDADMGKDMTYYTGSTTGTSRDNTVCSAYTPITWQVDRKCHLISASSFDKMCADMKMQRDDMSGDLYPHGSRTLVADDLAADNQEHSTGR